LRQVLKSAFGAVHGERSGTPNGHRAKVVYSVNMVCMRVRKEHSVDGLDSARNELQSQLRRRIQEETRSAARLHYGSDSCALVPGIGRAANVAAASYLRHSEARAGSQKRELQTISTFRKFVVPGTSKGTPAVTTTRSPVFARPWYTTAAIPYFTMES